MAVITGSSLPPPAIPAIVEPPASTPATSDYYGQLWVDLGNGRKGPRRISLVDQDGQPIRTLSAAKEALEIKRHERRENKLPAPGR